jgi:hypothetical protein
VLAPEVALDKLWSFDGPDEVAAFLADQQVTGRPRDSHECPLAVWLLAETGLVEVEVSEEKISGWRPLPDDAPPGRHTTDGLERECPWAIREFVQRYDSGRYPELVAEGFSWPDQDALDEIAELYVNA